MHLQIRNQKNRLIEIDWGMTHKGNLLAQNGWDEVVFAQRHMKMVSLIYTVFSRKIMRQLYRGICDSDEAKVSSAKKTCDWRFNCSLVPIQNINGNIDLII